MECSLIGTNIIKTDVVFFSKLLYPNFIYHFDVKILSVCGSENQLNPFFVLIYVYFINYPIIFNCSMLYNAQHSACQIC